MMNNWYQNFPDQGGRIVIIDGGHSQPRTKIMGHNPIEFPDFSTEKSPFVELGGWSGPPPGPPVGVHIPRNLAVTPLNPPVPAAQVAPFVRVGAQPASESLPPREAPPPREPPAKPSRRKS